MCQQSCLKGCNDQLCMYVFLFVDSLPVMYACECLLPPHLNLSSLSIIISRYLIDFFDVMLIFVRPYGDEFNFLPTAYQYVSRFMISKFQTYSCDPASNTTNCCISRSFQFIKMFTTYHKGNIVCKSKYLCAVFLLCRSESTLNCRCRHLCIKLRN